MTTARFAPGGHGVPADARQAGFEADHQLLYVARAWIDGGLHLGKWRAGWSEASISYGGQERWLGAFEIWVGRLSNGAGGTWDDAGSDGLVSCGHEADGTPLFPARVRHAGGLHLGKWQRGWTAAAFPYGGGEVWSQQFQVLADGQYIDGDDAFGWQR